MIDAPTLPSTPRPACAVEAADVPGRLLFCAPVPPEFDRESGSRRIYHMIRFLHEAGWKVAFVCENAPPGSRHLRHLRDLGIPAYVGFDGSTTSLVEAGAFDVAIFAFWYLADRYAERIRRLAPGIRVVVESVDLHWLREARRTFRGLDERRVVLDQRWGTDMARELNAYARADRVLTVSGKEAAIVNDVTGRSDLAVAVPDCDEIPRSPLGYEERRGILFVGNFRHPPNLDAIGYLGREILPLLPDALRAEHPVLVVGNGADDRVRAIVEDAEHVRLVGWVPELEPYLHRARVAVVPLRYGAGTKRKLIQSAMAGTPTVTTSIGVEGMELADGRHLLVEDDAGAFADAVQRLLVERELWGEIADAGREGVLALHGREATRTCLLRTIEDVAARPPRRPPTPRTVPDEGVEAFRTALEETVPPDGSVLVVSKGDPDLVDVDGLCCEHFPRDPGGGYAGYHPADGRAALRHLDATVGHGDYLALPPSSFWWLDHYPELSRHLETHFETVRSDDRCILFRKPPEPSLFPTPLDLRAPVRRVGVKPPMHGSNGSAGSSESAGSTELGSRRGGER